MTTTQWKNKPKKWLKDDLNGIVEVRNKGGGGSQVEYAQSPEERALMKLMLPTFDWIYGGVGGRPRTKLYDVPNMRIRPTTMRTPDSSGLTNIQDYVPDGETYNKVYGMIAPSLWQSYTSGVENPLIERFAGSGTLGSPSAGVSGAAMDALAKSRARASNDISAQAYNLAQQPLQMAYQGQRDIFSAANQRTLSDYMGRLQRNMTLGSKPWEAKVEQAQYPYQILPGIMGGVMPQPVVTQSGGK